MSQQSILEQLPTSIAKAENLPSPPAVAVEILRVTNDEDASIEDLAEIISRDPVLSAKLLKLANSAVFRRGAEVASLEMAAMRLGMKTVKLMALSFSLSNDLPRTGKGSGFDYTGHWKRSLTMAVAGRSWARVVGNPNGSEAFLCGLLGRLGQLVMAECLPGPYGEIIRHWQGDPALLARRLAGLLDLHLERTQGAPGHQADFEEPGVQLFPVEVLLVGSVRASLELPMPRVEHPLMFTNLVTTWARGPWPESPTLQRLERRLAPLLLQRP